MERDGARPGREKEGVTAEQSESGVRTRWEKDRGLEHSAPAPGGDWRGSNGRYGFYAGLRRGGGAAGECAARSAPASPDGLALATRTHEGHDASPALRTAPPPPSLQHSAVSPGAGGAGSPTSPLFPALRCPAQPGPARSGPARQHSRLRQLRRLLPCQAGFSPTHSRPKQRHQIRVRGARRVGTRGAFAPGTGS